MPVFLCVLCVARGCAVEAHRFVVFRLFCHSPLTHHASPPRPTHTPADGDVLAIKEHLIDELDYILVPTEGWNKLVSWYGLSDGQEPIARKVWL